MKTKLSTAVFLLIVIAFQGYGQISTPGIPYSSEYKIPVYSGLTVTAEAPSTREINSEDSIFPSPYRYAIVLPVDLDIRRDGQWDQVSGGMIWRGKISVPGAVAIALYFDDFYLPPGSSLFIYDEKKSKILGAFTERNNHPSGIFATELIPGESVILEYFRPSSVSGEAVIRVTEVSRAYRGVSIVKKERGFGGSGPCEVNIACPEGWSWRNEGKGVALIGVKKGNANYWCTGSLLNNTRTDHTPYFLTADHCGEGSTEADLQKWIFYFHYEAPECIDPLTPPVPRSMQGAVLRAHGGNSGSTGSDFFLVEFMDDIPEEYDVYFNGWDRLDKSSSSGVTIHQPQGDIQKISTYGTPTVSTNYGGNTDMCFWRVRWDETVSGHGVTEGGSSGSPLFNSSRRIVGTLTGGASSCDSIHLNDADYYGKFSWHWASNGNDSTSRLMDWLDPAGTGAFFMDGLPLGTGDISTIKKLKIYPNPCNDFINIDPGKLSGKGKISVYDISGRMVNSLEVVFTPGSSLKISIQDLTSGFYLLKAEKGEEIYLSKITVL